MQVRAISMRINDSRKPHVQIFSLFAMVHYHEAKAFCVVFFVYSYHTRLKSIIYCRYRLLLTVSSALDMFPPNTEHWLLSIAIWPPNHGITHDLLHLRFSKYEIYPLFNTCHNSMRKWLSFVPGNSGFPVCLLSLIQFIWIFWIFPWLSKIWR